MFWKKKYPCIRQHDQSDCAAAVVATVLKVYKKEMTIMSIRDIIGTDMYGTSVKGIVKGLEKLNFNVKAIRVQLIDITKEVTKPIILQVVNDLGMNHFAVLHDINKHGKFVIADPSKEEICILNKLTLEKMYQGVAILMSPTSEFEAVSKKDKSMFDLFKLLIFP